MTTPTPLRYFVIDAFADQPFSGNPAAVVLLDAWRAADWLQSVAMEMNLSETAFLVPNERGFDLRWFTPSLEVDLCGHATLAAARALSETGLLADRQEVAFSTRSGVLKASRQGDNFQLDFPLMPETETSPPDALCKSLAVTAKYVGKNRFDYLVEVESEVVVRGIKPDFKRLATTDCRGVMVTARSSNPAFDFVSRFFAPAAGIDEDPVTGSAHCCLANFWRTRLKKSKFVAYQASARGGVLHVEVRGDRVLLGGQAVIFARGELAVE